MKKIESKYDAFICGGGIAGLLTAYALGKLGRKVLVVEKNTAFNPNGADVLKPSGIEVLEQLGLYDALFEHGALKRDRVLIYHGGNLVAEMDYAQEHERKYFMLIPYRNVLNMILEKIKEVENIHILFNTELTSLTVDKSSDNVIEVLLNEYLTVKAKVYIAADGIMSKIRSMVSMPATIEKYAQQMYFAQFPMVDSVRLCNRLYVDKNYSLAYFYPVGTHSFRCVIGFSKEEGDRLFQSKDVPQLKNRIAQFVTESDDAIAAIDSLDNFATFPLCKMNMDSYYKGNVVFLGNSAHSIHPITGQGMNLAIEDAGMLYPLLENFFNGVIGLPEAFNRYQSKRHPINDGLINYGDRLIKSFDNRELFTQRLNLNLQTSNRTV
jgi:HQNO biosynthesis monooxygenase PqsL